MSKKLFYKLSATYLSGISKALSNPDQELSGLLAKDQINREIIKLNYLSYDDSISCDRTRKRLGCSRMSLAAIKLIESKSKEDLSSLKKRQNHLWKRSLPPAEKLEVEHPYERKNMIIKIMSGDMNEDEVFNLLWSNQPILITAEEHRRLPSLDVKDIDESVALQRYRDLGIEVKIVHM